MGNKITNVGWSIGNHCNAKCKHCYSWKTRKKSNDILTREEVDLIIDKLINYGVETVNFGGNEPIFTNGKDIEKTTLPHIISRLTDAGIACGITTNGYTALYLHENYHDVFMSVNDWDFSLDAPCKDEHNSNRNVKGSFEGVIEAIELCSEHKRPRSIVIAGMRWNIDIENLKKFLELSQKYNTELRINVLKPIEDHHFELLPSVEQIYNAFDYLFQSTDLITLSEPVMASQVGVESSGCPCGIHSFRIRSKIDGRVPVTPCVYLDLDGGDILSAEIDEIVCSDVFKEFNQRRVYMPQKCAELDCEVREQCRGGCAARTYLITGSYDNPDPYCPYLLKKEGVKVCQVAKPVFAEKSESKEIRVHENYLCTWIGKPKPQCVDSL